MLLVLIILHFKKIQINEHREESTEFRPPHVIDNFIKSIKSSMTEVHSE